MDSPVVVMSHSDDEDDDAPGPNPCGFLLNSKRTSHRLPNRTGPTRNDTLKQILYFRSQRW